MEFHLRKEDLDRVPYLKDDQSKDGNTLLQNIINVSF